MTVTDELLAELDRSVRVVWHDDDAAVIAVDTLTAEFRRLRVDNAELGGLLREAGKTIHQLQSEQPTPLRIARYLDAMRSKIDTAMATQ
mgnify:CR=1 FL=1